MKGGEAQLPFPLISHIGIREDIIHLYNELVFTWMDHQPLYSMKARAQLLLIFHRLFELLVYNVDPGISDFRIQKLTRYIAAHYREKFSMQKMASIIGLNPIYLNTLFKRETGGTPYQYLIKTRVRNAELMLHSGEFRVTEVALRCGYNDLFHFCKQFKRIYGVSPSQCLPKKNK
jgi:AraC-like DNA-binding protein